MLQQHRSLGEDSPPSGSTSALVVPNADRGVYPGMPTRNSACPLQGKGRVASSPASCPGQPDSPAARDSWAKLAASLLACHPLAALGQIGGWALVAPVLPWGEGEAGGRHPTRPRKRSRRPTLVTLALQHYRQTLAVAAPARWVGLPAARAAMCSARGECGPPVHLLVQQCTGWGWRGDISLPSTATPSAPPAPSKGQWDSHQHALLRAPFMPPPPTPKCTELSSGYLWLMFTNLTETN